MPKITMDEYLAHIREQHAQTGEGVTVAEVMEAGGVGAGKARRIIKREGWAVVGFRPNTRMDGHRCKTPVYGPGGET